jgi:hypothetical protein
MSRREWRAVQLRGEQHLFTHRLVEVDGSSESEAAALALHLVEAGEFHVAGSGPESDGAQQIAERHARPSAGADRLRSPGQLTRKRPQRQELGPAEPGADQGRVHAVTGKLADQIVEGKFRRPIHQSLDDETPGGWVDGRNGRVAAGKELLDGSDEALGGNDRPGAGVETPGIVGQTGRSHVISYLPQNTVPSTHPIGAGDPTETPHVVRVARW